MSQSKFSLPKEDADSLKCTKCASYLSVSPIMFSAEGYECGRCFPDSRKLEQVRGRATAYERLAKFVVFPCKFDSLGCNNLLNFNDTKNHEVNCKYRTITCPAIQCQVQVGLQEVLAHFQTKHPQLVVKSNQIDISSEEEMLENKIIIINQHFFLLKTMTLTDNKDKEFKLCLRSFGGNTISSYRLDIKSKENSNHLVLDQQKILPYLSVMKYTTHHLPSIDLNAMATVLKSRKIFVQFNFGEEVAQQGQGVKSPSKGCDAQILDHLECVVCKEYMTPPIFICKTGHSVCFKCKNALTSCPTCKSRYEGARNFTLEKLAEDLEFPKESRPTTACSNSKVASQPNPNPSKSVAKSVRCYLAKDLNCKWKGPPNKLQDHLNSAHPLSIRARLNTPMYYKFDSDDYYSRYYILSFDEHNFKVSIRHNNRAQAVFWHVEDISLGVDYAPRYQFFVEFIDDQTNTTLIASALCYPSDNKDKVLKICHQVLDPFFDNYKLYFKINIKKVNSY